MIENTYRIAEVEMTYKYSIPFKKRQDMTNSKNVCDTLKAIIGDRMDYKEVFIVLFLDKACNMTGYNVHATGGLDGCFVDVRQVMQGALLTNSVGIIIAHNHPSGNLHPSIQDKQITKCIQQACKTLEIHLLDHLILTADDFYSFKDKGDL